jgi:dTDP-glucose 4,6-dehydratase
MKILVTGGAGFIGSAIARMLIHETDHDVLVVDKLTYAGSKNSLASIEDNSRFTFLQHDICDRDDMHRAFAAFKPNIIMHLAAESHVDRSINAPAEFIQTNIVGTYTLLETARAWHTDCGPDEGRRFRFLHVSTDEVFGSLGDSGQFNEESRYHPNSPYAASKASSDHLVRAWGATFGLPVIVSHCSNNYGPYQFPEKFIPLLITNAIDSKPLPIYGNGQNVRDWIHVDDHAAGLIEVALRADINENFLFGGGAERRNLETAIQICGVLDRLCPRADGSPYRQMIRFVADRAGHDRRYASDISKIARVLNWRPRISFEQGIEATVRWYLENSSWWRRRQASAQGGSP